MTLEALHTALGRLLERDPDLGRAHVAYDDMRPVEGGILLRKDGAAILNLAPIKLDQVGGF